MQRQLIFLELNEVNFEFLLEYAARGDLPNISALLARHGFARTASETEYQNLEPWIQWVTAHTGLTFAEHGVFRLGDIVNKDIPQIWESLEASGLRVGAISPMNAKYRLRDPLFFVPDPWTSTRMKARPVLRRLYESIAQAVNDNAQATISVRSLVHLVTGFLAYARLGSVGTYLAYASTARRKPWRKAIVLDMLLADVYMKETARTRPDFSTLFLNAAAHIQHHYLFSSAVYRGEARNPEWYVTPGADPVLEVYRAYDRIVGRILKEFGGARIMIGTGLHQNPHPTLTYYWRLKDHKGFLQSIGIAFQDVLPRMSRDFLVTFDSHASAAHAEAVLLTACSLDGSSLFETDNRGKDVFVTFIYSKDISGGHSFRVADKPYQNLRDQVAFVAIKNGEHDGTGYFLDTGANLRDGTSDFPLREIPERIKQALGVGTQGDLRTATS